MLKTVKRVVTRSRRGKNTVSEKRIIPTMLASVEVRNLLQNTKIDKVLGTNLLPANNNPSFLDLDNVTTVTVVEDDPKGAVPVAFGLFHRITPAQVYCVVVTFKKTYDNNFVAIEQVKNDMGLEDEDNRHTCYKITEVRDKEEDLSSMPQYFSAFEKHDVYPLHQVVIDTLIDRTIGHVNMDMKRNITVDLYDTHSGRNAEVRDELWRDRSGFIVADRWRFAEIEISRAALQSVLQKSAKDEGITFEPLGKKSIAAFLEYDTEIAANDRSQHLEYLFRLPGSKGTVVLDKSKRPAGYVVSLGNRILQCYGETPQIANALLAKHVSQMIEPTIALFIRVDNSWISKELTNAATITRRVRRFHTRIIPSQVKWSKVFAVNIGMYLY